MKLGTMKFGTDGVRGVAHDELTTEFAARLARAASRVLGASAVVVGGDTRVSTPDFVDALTEGFASAGVAVVQLGVVPTPVVAFEAQRRGAMGAVVSASHNPYHDNGIKLFAVGGTKLGDDVQIAIEAAIDAGAAATSETEARHESVRVGTASASDDVNDYEAHVLALLEGRRLDGMRIVVDAANGAAFAIAPAVLRAAGAEVIAIGVDPDGRNINDRCGATHPEAVAVAVREHAADVGIALDGDADRLIAVDHRGDVVDGDHIIAICANDLRERGRLAHDTVVITVMANLGFRRAMDDAGITVVETAVGDRYVLEALAAGGFSLGGEQSGHVVFADHATTGDGLLTAIALLDVVRRSGRPLADIAADAMTSLPQVLVNVRVATTAPDVAERLADEIAEVEARLRSGAGAGGRVLVRASGTEPLIRVMVEAETADDAQRVADHLADVARRRFG